MLLTRYEIGFDDGKSDRAFFDPPVGAVVRDNAGRQAVNDDGSYFFRATDRELVRITDKEIPFIAIRGNDASAFDRKFDDKYYVPLTEVGNG